MLNPFDADGDLELDRCADDHPPQLEQVRYKFGDAWGAVHEARRARLRSDSWV